MAETKIRNKQLRSDYQTIIGAKTTQAADNSYLQSWFGEGMNAVPVILAFDAYLVAMSLSTDGAETWTAEIEVDGVLKTGATLSVAAADSAYDDSYMISFDAGDKIMFRVDSTGNIQSPHVEAVFKRRYN
jgi:hypothetical protein